MRRYCDRTTIPSLFVWAASALLQIVWTSAYMATPQTKQRRSHLRAKIIPVVMPGDGAAYLAVTLVAAAVVAMVDGVSRPPQPGGWGNSPPYE